MRMPNPNAFWLACLNESRNHSRCHPPSNIILFPVWPDQEITYLAPILLYISKVKIYYHMMRAQFLIKYYILKSHIILSPQIIIMLLFTPEMRLLSSFSLLSAAIWFPSGRYKGTILSSIILTVNLLCSVSHIAWGAIREFASTIIFYFLAEHVSSADLNGWRNAAPQASYVHK